MFSCFPSLLCRDRIAVRPLQWIAPRRGNDTRDFTAQVTVLPMSHIAAPEFYDSTLHYARAQLHQQLPLTHIFLEGVTSDEAELAQHNKEIETIRTNPRLIRDRLEQSVALLSQDAQRQQCAVFGISYPLPHGLTFQDAYWKPRLLLEDYHLLGTTSIRIVDKPFTDLKGLDLRMAAQVRDAFLASHVVSTLNQLRSKSTAPSGVLSPVHILLPWGHSHAHTALRFILVEQLKFEERVVDSIEFNFGITKEVRSLVLRQYLATRDRPIA